MYESYILERDNDLQVIVVTKDSDPLYSKGSWNLLAGPMPLTRANNQMDILVDRMDGSGNLISLRTEWENLLGGIPCQVAAFIDRGYLCHAIWVAASDYHIAYDALILNDEVDMILVDLEVADQQYHYIDTWYRRSDGTSSIGW